MTEVKKVAPVVTKVNNAPEVLPYEKGAFEVKRVINERKKGLDFFINLKKELDSLIK